MLCLGGAGAEVDEAGTAVDEAGTAVNEASAAFDEAGAAVSCSASSSFLLRGRPRGRFMAPREGASGDVVAVIWVESECAGTFSAPPSPLWLSATATWSTLGVFSFARDFRAFRTGSTGSGSTKSRLILYSGSMFSSRR